jgi:hypothetical protein
MRNSYGVLSGCLTEGRRARGRDPYNGTRAMIQSELIDTGTSPGLILTLLATMPRIEGVADRDWVRAVSIIGNSCADALASCRGD